MNNDQTANSIVAGNDEVDPTEATNTAVTANGVAPTAGFAGAPQQPAGQSDDDRHRDNDKKRDLSTMLMGAVQSEEDDHRKWSHAEWTAIHKHSCELGTQFIQNFPTTCTLYTVNYYGIDGVNHFYKINMDGKLHNVSHKHVMVPGPVKWSVTYSCANAAVAGQTSAPAQEPMTLPGLTCDTQGLKDHSGNAITNFASLISNLPQPGVTAPTAQSVGVPQPTNMPQPQQPVIVV